MAKKEKLEMVEITLRLPKQFVEFVKIRVGKDLEKYLAAHVVDSVFAALEAGEFTPDPGEIMEKHGLFPVFKEYGVLPSYYGE